MENIEKFGRLTIIERRTTMQTEKVTVRCDCGTVKQVSYEKLVRKVSPTRSCGCLRKDFDKTRKGRGFRHGMTSGSEKDPAVYVSWASMKQRCLNPKQHHYHDYGGRGIKVCDRWLDFRNFYEDMGEKPDNMTLDRIDANGDYCPENCRWATLTEQNNNRRNVPKFLHKGIEKTISEIAKAEKLPHAALRSRITKRGQSVDDAIFLLRDYLTRGLNKKKT